MKITREEFKELVEVCDDLYFSIEDAMKTIKDNVVCDLALPVLNWLTDTIGISDKDNDLILDYCFDKKIPISWDTDENGVVSNIECTDDLDRIYDKYIAENGKGE